MRNAHVESFADVMSLTYLRLILLTACRKLLSAVTDAALLVSEESDSFLHYCQETMSFAVFNDFQFKKLELPQNYRNL